jgi:hypothetical protein
MRLSVKRLSWSTPIASTYDSKDGHMINQTKPRLAPAEVFWGELAPFEHSVQVYPNKEIFLDALEGFVSSGLRSGDGVIVIAEAAHREALERRLRQRGFGVDTALAEERYIPLDAEATLAQFMVDGWPDEVRFREEISGLLARARGDGRRVRAFGEMVVLLWRQGHATATVRLEWLWNKVCEEEALSLFCAYPETGFTQDIESSINEICRHHSRVINL